MARLICSHEEVRTVGMERIGIRGGGGADFLVHDETGHGGEPFEYDLDAYLRRRCVSSELPE